MDRRTEHDPAREEMNREHGRSDRGGPGREQAKPQPFPPRDYRPESGATGERQFDERGQREFDERRKESDAGERRPPSKSGERPGQQQPKFGERRKGSR